MSETIGNVDLKKLKGPFSSLDIEWRVQSSGMKGDKPWAMVLAYVTARAIQNRLDDVCGPENWKVDYSSGPDGGVLCGISIKCGDEWITKWDGAENTNIDAVKGGISSALKRAGSVWGIGRYLYGLKSYWAVFVENGEYNSKIENKWCKWNAPQLPKWALPGDEAPLVKDPETPKDTKEQPKQAQDGAQPATGGLLAPTEPPENEQDRLSRAQIGLIHGKLGGLGITDDLAKHEKVSELMGYNDVIESFGNLDRKLLQSLINKLEELVKERAI